MMYVRDKKPYFLEKAKESIGQTFNDLTVLEVLGMRKYGHAMQTFVKCKCSCGNIVEVPLSQVRYGCIKTCGHKKAKNLQKTHSAHTHGTYLYAIGNQRTHLQSNNHTGVNGVCMRNGRYRAYITFRRKQYHLGTYGTLDEASAARKIAEKEIHGEFLSWYTKEFPGVLENLKRKGENE